MGALRNFFLGVPPQAWQEPVAAPRFAVDATSIPAQIFGLTDYASSIAVAARISRREAIQVPAVKRARDLIAGSLGQLPLHVIDSENVTLPHALLDQPERDVPRSVTMTWTLEDLLFEGVAWWIVTERGFDGYPRFVKRAHPSDVSVNEDTGRVTVKGKPVPANDVIKFTSPHDALLDAGARAIRTCLRLDTAASKYAEGVPPLDFFTPADAADPVDDDEIVDLLNAWKSARQERSTAYVPAALKYTPVTGFSPEQLQLADARQHAVLEIARVTGIDPTELGVAVTNRPYLNQQQARKDFIDFTLGGFRQAVEDRLSMGDVTKRGYHVRFNLSDFLRSDDLTRMQVHDYKLRLGIETPDEAREDEGKPPLPENQRPAITPAPTTEDAA